MSGCLGHHPSALPFRRRRPPLGRRILVFSTRPARPRRRAPGRRARLGLGLAVEHRERRAQRLADVTVEIASATTLAFVLVSALRLLKAARAGTRSSAYRSRRRRRCGLAPSTTAESIRRPTRARGRGPPGQSSMTLLEVEAALAVGCGQREPGTVHCMCVGCRRGSAGRGPGPAARAADAAGRPARARGRRLRRAWARRPASGAPAPRPPARGARCAEHRLARGIDLGSGRREQRELDGHPGVVALADVGERGGELVDGAPAARPRRAGSACSREAGSCSETVTRRVGDLAERAR